MNQLAMFRRRVVVVILAVGVLLIVACAGYRHFNISRPVGSGPAGPSVNRADFANSWTTQRVFLVGLGDSVTAGFGARHGYSYFDRLVANPPDEYAQMKGLCLSAV